VCRYNSLSHFINRACPGPRGSDISSIIESRIVLFCSYYTFAKKKRIDTIYTMIGTSEGLKIVRSFQAMFAVLVLGLAANSVHWYTSTIPGLQQMDGAPLATAGCALCILAAIATVGFVLAQKLLADAFAVILWVVACGVMAAGSSVVANDPDNESCSPITGDCTSAGSSIPWATGVAAAVFAGLQSGLFVLSSILCFRN